MKARKAYQKYIFGKTIWQRIECMQKDMSKYQIIIDHEKKEKKMNKSERRSRNTAKEGLEL